MHIAVHARDVHPASLALASGATAAGVQLLFRRPMDNCGMVEGVDAALVLMAGPNQQRLVAEYVAAGVPVYFMELPRLRMASGIDENARTDSHGFYRDSLHYVPETPGGVARVFGVIQGRKPEHIIVCGQKPNDAQHHMTAYGVAAWAGATIAATRQYGLPIIYRPHPRAVETMGDAETFGADGVSRPAAQTLRQALHRAAAIVTYNSTSGLDAIDAGVPVLYTAPREVVAYAPWAAPLGAPLTPLSPADRENCLLRFAACQFTREEVRNGTMFRVMFLGEPHPETRIEVVGGESAPPVMPTPRKRGRPRKVAA